MTTREDLIDFASWLSEQEELDVATPDEAVDMFLTPVEESWCAKDGHGTWWALNPRTGLWNSDNPSYPQYSLARKLGDMPLAEVGGICEDTVIQNLAVDEPQWLDGDEVIVTSQYTSTLRIRRDGKWFTSWSTGGGVDYRLRYDHTIDRWSDPEHPLFVTVIRKRGKVV